MFFALLQVDLGFLQDASGGWNLPIVALALGAVLLALIILILWLSSVVNIVSAKNKIGWKILWIFVLVLLGPLGIIVYLFVGKKSRLDKKFEETRQQDNFTSDSGKFVPDLKRLSLGETISKSEFETKEQKELAETYKSAKEYQQEKTSYEPQNISTQQPVQAQLSSEETEQVRQLVEILIFDKQNYSSEQVYKVILEKGYSDGVAKEAVKQIYGETPSF